MSFLSWKWIQRVWNFYYQLFLSIRIIPVYYQFHQYVSYIMVVLLVEWTQVLGENHWPASSNWHFYYSEKTTGLHQVTDILLSIKVALSISHHGQRSILQTNNGRHELESNYQTIASKLLFFCGGWGHSCFMSGDYITNT